MKTNIFFKTFKSTFLAAFVLIGLSFSNANAQDETITDEELTNYAEVMDSIEVMKIAINDTINAMIQNEELMQRGKRFVEIRGAGGDSVKLGELNVTEEELAAYDTIQGTKQVMATELNGNVNALVTEELGAAAYNKINKALRSDEEVKERYDAILSEVQAKGNNGEEGGMEGEDTVEEDSVDEGTGQ